MSMESDQLTKGSFGQYRFKSLLFFGASVVALNGCIWQIKRRNEKVQHLADCANLELEPLKELPSADNPAKHRQPVILRGTLDNEGSVLVGPREMPNNSQRNSGDNIPGGFFVLTPFEIAETKQVVMVNRGWVPMSAAKSRLHLAQYIGEGFKSRTLRGIVVKAEESRDWKGNLTPDNFQKGVTKRAWMLIRPVEIAREYYARRFDKGDIVEKETLHGTRPYVIEMIEDHSGDDQVIIDNKVYPYRRDRAEMEWSKLPVITHVGYAAFWLFITCLAASMGVHQWRRAVEATALTKLRKDQFLKSQERMTKSKEQWLNTDVGKSFAQKNPEAAKLATPEAAYSPIVRR